MLGKCQNQRSRLTVKSEVSGLGGDASRVCAGFGRLRLRLRSRLAKKWSAPALEGRIGRESPLPVKGLPLFTGLVRSAFGLRIATEELLHDLPIRARGEMTFFAPVQGYREGAPAPGVASRRCEARWRADVRQQFTRLRGGGRCVGRSRGLAERRGRPQVLLARRHDKP
jgi:hypothetical protein